MKKLSILVAGLMGTAPVMAELTTDAYGSIRMQAESVSVDQAAVGLDDSYTGVRDAFSRVGVKADYAAANGWNFGAKLEIPFNTKDMKAEDPTYFQGFYKDNDGPRVAKVTASKDGLGSVAVGMQWLTYYNYVAYPVDFFSSFYSGWATHAAFRREAVTYYAPTFNNISIVASAVDMTDGNDDYLDTQEYAISYSKDGISAALGYQAADEGARDLMGASASYTTGPWRFAAKVETLEGLTGEEDATIYNVYGSYKLNDYTFKAMYANGDDVTNGGAYFKGNTYHLGTDYQYTDNFMVFAEYFYEENPYAIYEEDSSGYGQQGATGSSGSAIAIGARYDF